MTNQHRSDSRLAEPEVSPPIATDASADLVTEPGSAEPAPRSGSTEPAPRSGSAEPAPDLAALLKKAEDEVTEAKDAWLRARADVENVRRQAQNDVAKAYKYAIEKFAEELLPVKDALESTLATDNAPPEALRSGVELTLKQLVAAFDKSRIREVNPAGERFDPHQHEAVAMVDSDQPPNTVVTVFQKGYLLNDRVLRPARVAVAKGGDGNR